MMTTPKYADGQEIRVGDVVRHKVGRIGTVQRPGSCWCGMTDKTETLATSLTLLRRKKCACAVDDKRSPCPRCNEPMEGEECGSWCATTEHDRDGIHAAGRTFHGWQGRNVNGDGRTITSKEKERKHLERWSAEYYTISHCPKCGCDTGCFCPRVKG